MNENGPEPLDAIDNFITLGHQLAQLPDLSKPQYAPAARDLQEISQKLSRANENMARWLYQFLYFDFLADDARSAFLALVREYRTAKASDRLNEMKYRCGDIEFIFGLHIEGSLGGWLGGQSKKHEHASKVFEELGSADASMVAFIHDELVGKLDAFVREVEPLVDKGALDEAERVRLRLKVEWADLSEKLERFSSGLSELVLEFSRLGGQPVTLDETAGRAP